MDFKDVIVRYIKPLFPVAKFCLPSQTAKKFPNRGNDYCSTNSTTLILRKDKNKKCEELRKNDEEVYLQQSQLFSDIEKKVVNQFLRILFEKKIYELQYENDILDKIYNQCLRRALMDAVLEEKSTTQNFDLIHKVDDLCQYWSKRTYEGNKVSFAIKLPDKLPNHDIDLQEYKEDYFASLTNGIDECLSIGENGKISSYLGFFKEGISIEDEKLNAPYRFLRLCKNSGKNGVLALTRNNEILYFKESLVDDKMTKELVFAERNQQFILYSHSANIRKMADGKRGVTFASNLLDAMYKTALDVSYTRTGAILACVDEKNNSEKLRKLIGDDNYTINGKGKQETIKKLINGKCFQELDRALRAELASMDGAFIFDRHGNILTVGTIINLEKGGGIINGGGRKTATLTLAKYGLAIKISNDTYIECYDEKNISSPLLVIGAKNS